MTDRILTMTDVVALETICSAAQRTARVAWLLDGGHVAYGTARSIGDQNGNFLSQDMDVRDGYLRVTTVGGMEAFLPVLKLMEQVGAGEFCEYDWRQGYSKSAV